MTETPWIIVPGQAKHLNFIRSAWCKGGIGDYMRAYRHEMDVGDCNEDLPRYIANLLQLHPTRVAVSEDGEDYYGFASGGQSLHYVYVKRALRGFGVARALVEALGFREGNVPCTTWNHICDKLKESHGLRYRPLEMFK